MFVLFITDKYYGRWIWWRSCNWCRFQNNNRVWQLLFSLPQNNLIICSKIKSEFGREDAHKFLPPEHLIGHSFMVFSRWYLLGFAAALVIVRIHLMYALNAGKYYTFHLVKLIYMYKNTVKSWYSRFIVSNIESDALYPHGIQTYCNN